ncbi:MAG: hypothetical protein IT324_16755 [Anaerolineae bacterium]|nr:hypothetical protein [Anaerolineae bacterium]
MTFQARPQQPDSQSALWDTVTPGITQAWRFDKRIVMFHLHSQQPGVMDRYYDAIARTMLEWPANQMFLCLYDFSAPSVGMAAYGRQRMRDLITLQPSLEGYGAVVVSEAYECWARTMLQAQLRDSRRYALFRTCDEGLWWLSQKLSLRPLGQIYSSRRDQANESPTRLFKRLL